MLPTASASLASTCTRRPSPFDRRPGPPTGSNATARNRSARPVASAPSGRGTRRDGQGDAFGQVREGQRRVREPHRGHEVLLEGAARSPSRSSRSALSSPPRLARASADSNAISEPAPAALPTASTWSRSQSGISPSTMAYAGSMWLPNAPVSRISSTVIHAEVVHQQSAACLERSLGQLDRAYVGLGDLDDRVVPQPVGEGAVVRHHPARGRVAGSCRRHRSRRPGTARRSPR